MVISSAEGARVTSSPQTAIALDLLDSFRLRINSGVVELSDMTQRLVALVALSKRPLCRSLVAGTLWPEKSEARALANLRSSLWRLNAVDSSHTIISLGSSLALNPEVVLDVASLEREGWALLDGRADPDAVVCSEWFSQELLPGWYDDWVIVERERFGQLQIRFLEAFVHRLRAQGDLARAIDQAMRLVAIDPLRERSQLALIRALLDEGSWGRARWQAEHYSAILVDTFGCRATDSFMDEYRALLPFEPALSVDL
jgi:DNA-binding SARP family transcriptional activator